MMARNVIETTAVENLAENFEWKYFLLSNGGEATHFETNFVKSANLHPMLHHKLLNIYRDTQQISLHLSSHDPSHPHLPPSMAFGAQVLLT